MKAWLRRWLGIERLAIATNESLGAVDRNFTTTNKTVATHAEQIHLLQNEIRELRAEVTKLTIAQYVPPQQPEPEKKIIQTRTMKQYLDILEREQETSDAL